MSTTSAPSGPSAPSGLSLRELQLWFHEQLAGPNARPARDAADDAAAARIVCTSDRLTPADRVHIYTGMYFMRLFEVMTDDFPTTRHLLGEAEWNEVVRGYLTQYPSRSWTLDLLGDRFAGYLAARTDLPRAALLADIARIEFALSEVFSAPDGPVLTPDEFAAVPPEQWATAQLTPQSAFQLLQFDHPVAPILNAVRNDEPLPSLEPTPAWAVIYRKEFRAWRRNLTEPMFVALSALAGGASIPETLEAVTAVWPGSDEELEQAVFSWFQEWVAEGLFAAVQHPG